MLCFKFYLSRSLSSYGSELKSKNTIYMYFRFSRAESTLPINEQPESIVSNAIARVVLTDENTAIKPHPLPCHISSLSQVFFFFEFIVLGNIELFKC